MFAITADVNETLIVDPFHIADAAPHCIPPPADSGYDYDCSAGRTSVRQPHLVNPYRFFDHTYTKTVPLWEGP